MTSKIVVAHQKISGEIAAALRTHGPAIAEAVREATRAEGPKSAVDVGPLLAWAGRASARALAALEAADNTYQKELGDDDEPRARRDAAAAELYRALVGLKSTTRSLFGDAWVSKLTFPKEVPADPSHLSRAAAQVIDALATHRLPRPQVMGVGDVDGAAWRRLLQGPLDALTAALGDVKREEEEALATRKARDAALATLVAANVNAAQLAQVLARVGGVAELLEGLRGTPDTSGSASGGEDAQPVTDPVRPTPPTG